MLINSHVIYLGVSAFRNFLFAVLDYTAYSPPMPWLPEVKGIKSKVFKVVAKTREGIKVEEAAETLLKNV